MSEARRDLDVDVLAVAIDSAMTDDEVPWSERPRPAQVAAEYRRLSAISAVQPHPEAALVVTAYAVVYSNYSPAEIDSLWVTAEDAEAEAERRGDPWHVETWTLRRRLMEPNDG